MLQKYKQGLIAQDFKRRLQKSSIKKNEKGKGWIIRNIQSLLTKLREERGENQERKPQKNICIKSNEMFDITDAISNKYFKPE